MPVSLLLFLGLENLWLCDSIKSITLVPIIIWDTNIPKDIFCYSNTKIYTSHVIWKMIHIRCGLKLFKNLIIRKSQRESNVRTVWTLACLFSHKVGKNLKFFLGNHTMVFEIFFSKGMWKIFKKYCFR